MGEAEIFHALSSHAKNKDDVRREVIPLGEALEQARRRGESLGSRIGLTLASKVIRKSKKEEGLELLHIEMKQRKSAHSLAIVITLLLGLICCGGWSLAIWQFIITEGAYGGLLLGACGIMSTALGGFGYILHKDRNLIYEYNESITQCHELESESDQKEEEAQPASSIT